MANFKRKRAKNQRAGCLLCKPWKTNGFARRSKKDGERFSDHRRRLAGLRPAVLGRDSAAQPERYAFECKMETL